MHSSVRILLCLSMALSASACDRKPPGDKTAGPSAPVEKGMPLDRGVSEAVATTARMHKVAGRWQSAPDVIKGGKGQWVTLDVANDRSFDLQVRERAPDGRAEAVDVSVAGKFEWDPKGVIVAKGSGAKAPLQAFSSWRGTFDTPTAMRVTAGGQSYVLNYKGL